MVIQTIASSLLVLYAIAGCIASEKFTKKQNVTYYESIGGKNFNEDLLSLILVENISIAYGYLVLQEHRVELRLRYRP